MNSNEMTATTIDTESPGSPPNQALNRIAMVAIATWGYLIEMPRAANAPVNSRSASKTAVVTNAAKMIGAKVSVVKMIASRPSPTRIEGINLLPARLFSASLKAWRSLMATRG